MRSFMLTILDHPDLAGYNELFVVAFRVYNKRLLETLLTKNFIALFFNAKVIFLHGVVGKKVCLDHPTRKVNLVSSCSIGYSNLLCKNVFKCFTFQTQRSGAWVSLTT